MKNSGNLAKTRLIFSFVSFVTLLIGVFLGAEIVEAKYERFKDNNITKIITIYDTLKKDWIYANDYEDFDSYLTKWAIEGMTNDNKDPYTFYTSTYDQQGLGINYKGLGISHAFYGGDRIIHHVFKNSPAQKAGLYKGDVILGMYESSTSDEFIEFSSLSAQEALDAFSNYDKEEIKLKIKKTNNNIQDITIARDEYEQTSISSSFIVENGKVILTVTIQNFLDSNMVKDFREAIDETINQKGRIDDLIIDLRDNGGGRTDYASTLASMFIPEGSTICKYELKDGTIYEDINNRRPYYANIPKIKLLQNHGTASASEMFILALKDNLPEEKVEVIGTNSYGKGIRQTVKPLSDGSYIRYTDAKVLSPKGYSIHGVGIEPTIRVEYDYDLMNYYGEIGFVTKEYQSKILAQINGVLGSRYLTYQEGLEAYLISRLPSQTDFNYIVGRQLQKDGYDMYLQAMNNIASIALGE